jgi:hypothetical protein
LIRSDEDVLLVLAVSVVPVALYVEDDELDSESCSDWRNCCRTSLIELVPDELVVLPDELVVPSAGDELSAALAPPWPP